MSEANQDEEGWILDIEALLEKGVGALLKEPEIAGACKGWLKDELGCKPPVNHALFFCFRKALDFAAKGASVGVGTRLLALAQTNDLVGKFLSFIADTSRAASERNAFKDKILAAYNCDRTDDDLKADAATPIEVVVALRQGQLLEELQETLGTDFNELLGDLRQEFNAHTQTLKDVTYKWELNSDADRSAATSVKYDSGMYPLVGRDEELDILRSFLGDLSLTGPKHQFRWVCMTGEGGEGKTRLAFDFLTMQLPTGWTGGLLHRPSIEKLTIWQNWLPAAPTLFVIDYPAQNPRLVGELLNTLMLRSDTFGDPVRVLLLERNTSGPWYEDMIGAKAADAKLKNHIFRRGQYEDGWMLSPLHPEFIVELMEERFKRDGVEPPEPDILLNAAVKVDTRLIGIPEQLRRNLIEKGIPAEKIPDKIGRPPRALFAVATAELAVRLVLEADEPLADPFEELSRDEVLTEILRRERKEIWQKAIPQSVGDHATLLEAHENLLALATLMRGITREHLSMCSPETQNELPGLSISSSIRWNKTLIDRMGSHDADTALQGLEPDLLGEYFFFQVFSRISASAVTSFIADAFSLKPDQSALSLFLVLRDYPEKLAAYNYMQPGHSAGRTASFAWMRVLKDVVSHLGDDGNFDQLELVLAKAAAIHSNFPGDAAIALQEMEALTNGVNQTGKHQDWARFDKLVQRAEALQGVFPGDAAIALEEMKALTNGVSDTGEHQDWARFDRLVQRAGALQGVFPGDAAIALEEMKALFNGMSQTGEHQDWERFDRLVQRAGAPQSAFPGDAAIALQEMQALTNGVSDTGKHQDWERFDRLVQRAGALQGVFPGDAAIALEEMKALTNGVSDTGEHQDWARFDRLVQRAGALQSAFPKDAAIALVEMQALTNGATQTGKHQDWERFERIMLRSIQVVQSITMGPEHFDLFFKILIGGYVQIRKHLPKESHELKDMIGSILMAEAVLEILVQTDEHSHWGVAVIADALISSDYLKASDAFEALLENSKIKLGDIPTLPDA